MNYDKLKGNVVDGELLNDRLSTILDYLAVRLAKTLGPYGHNTLIQQTNGIVTTKDGWNVLQNIHFENTIDNSIKGMIESVAQSVVLKVGDGTTTSIVLTNQLLKFITELKDNDNLLTIRDIEDALTYCIERISDQLAINGTIIDKSNMRQCIYNIAMVSSNWDEELSNMIADIYVETENPIIKVQDSGTYKTSYSIIDGYDLSGQLLCKNYHINNATDMTCEVKEPLILLLNFQVTEKYYQPLSLIGGICDSMNRKFIVMAPGFDTQVIGLLNSSNNRFIHENKGPMNLIPFKFINNFVIDRECVEDFSVLSGATMVSKYDNELDIEQFFEDVSKTLTESFPGGDEEEFKRFQEDKGNFMITAFEYICNICGTCGEAILSEKSIVIKELNEDTKDIIENRKALIESEIDNKTKECDALTMITDDIRLKRIRLGKLNGKIGVISVGSYGSGDLKARKDSIDDTIRACESAYRYGFNVGGSIAPCIAINDILISEQGKNTFSQLENQLFVCIHDAFYKVFETIIDNKIGDGVDEIYVVMKDGNDKSMTLEDIFEYCTDNICGYDIITSTFDHHNRIINPVNVDIEVLRGCLRLILIIVTSDQFVYRPYSKTDSEIFNEDNDDRKIETTIKRDLSLKRPY